jgi:hypothetical protein
MARIQPASGGLAGTGTGREEGAVKMYGIRRNTRKQSEIDIEQSYPLQCKTVMARCAAGPVPPGRLPDPKKQRGLVVQQKQHPFRDRLALTAKPAP